MQRILRELQIEYQLNAPLATLTSYRVGGAAQVLARPASMAQLSALVAAIHAAAEPLRVLGSGANLLVADQGDAQRRADARAARHADQHFHFGGRKARQHLAFEIRCKAAGVQQLCVRERV